MGNTQSIKLEFGHMKHLFLVMIVGVLVGCGKKESTQLSSSNTDATESKTTAGDKLWEFETGDQVSSSPAIGSDGTVYVGSYDKKLYAINGKTGVKLWEFETGDEVYSPAIGSDGTVYVGSWDKKLYAISGQTGGKLWEFKTGNIVSSSPAIGSDGTVYVGSSDKKLYAINGQTGVKLWEIETGGFVLSSPAIDSDGTVYVGSLDKKLYAIKTDSKGPAKSPWPMFGHNAQRTGHVMK